jgi:hypothetical protein
MVDSKAVPLVDLRVDQWVVRLVDLMDALMVVMWAALKESYLVVS